MKLVLLYGFEKNKERFDALKNILAEIEIAYKIIENEDLNQVLGYMLEKKGYEANQDKYKGQAFDSEIMILNELKDPQIYDILNRVKQENMNPIRIKAVVTKHNVNWKLCDLFSEISEESAIFARREVLHAQLSEANALKKDEFTSESWEPYEKQFLYAYVLFKTSEISLKELEDCIEQLAQRREALIHI